MSQVKLIKEKSIAVISIDRPEALNALSREIVDEMDALVDEVAEDERIACLVLHSNKNFAAGADIKKMAECNEEEAKAFLFAPTYNKIANLDIPVIAAMEGYALGGGLELALTADIRIAEENAKMGFPEISLGIFPGAGGTVRAPKLIGMAMAKELIYTGRAVSATKAENMGLINRVVPDGTVYEEAMKLAQKIAGASTVALKAVKRTMRAEYAECDQTAAIAIESENWAKLFNSKDQKEGMHAYLEKRKPVFKNK